MDRANRPGPFWWRNLFPTDSVATDAILLNLDPRTIQTAQLCNAISKGDKLKVKLLLAKGALSNEYWGEPLHCAVFRRDLEMAEILLTAGAHPDGLPYWSFAEEQSDFTSSLHQAVGNSHKEMVQLLLSKGANVNQENYDGWTPLLSASYGGKLDMVQLLVANGADVNASTYEEGVTPLMLAAESCPVPIAAFLVSKGAKVNATDNNERTALMHAAMDGDADMCEYLISQGADVDAWDMNGYTAANHYYASGLATRIPGPEAFNMN